MWLEPKRMLAGVAVVALVTTTVARAPSRARPLASSAALPVPVAPVDAARLGAPALAAAEVKPARCPAEPPLEATGFGLPASFAPLVGEAGGMVGSGSLGTPTRGSLFGGVELHSGDGIERAGGYGWGTSAVVRSIERAVREVRRCHPGTSTLYVGDIAREHGGWLRPHRSHQSGLDADIGYYYVGPATWYQRATAANLDAPRTWALMRALIDGGNVDTIFVDASIQRLLKIHIATLSEGERPVADLFESPLHRDALIRHAWGHATHFHVRFRDPAAIELGKALTRIDPTGQVLRDAPLARLSAGIADL